MVIVELAVQGVRGCSSSTRVPIKPGHVLLKPPSVTVPPLCGVVTALCFADGRGGDAALLAPGVKSGKAGLMILGKDQVTYRILRELGGSGALHRVSAGGQLELVSEDVTEIGQFLRSQVGVPPRTAFEQLFCFTATQLPTLRPKGGQKGAAAGPLGALLASTPAVTDAASGEARLAQLQRELALSQEIEQLQYRLDGLSGQIFELEAKLKSADGLKAAIQEAEQELASAPTPETLGLPKDIASRAQRYPQLIQRRDEALAKLEAEREQAVQSAPAVAIEPVYRDPRFLGAVGLGAAFFALGMMLSGYLRYVALLDIPAFGFAALVALKWVDDLQGATRISRKGDFLAAREKKIRDEFESEAAHVRKAMATAKVETPEELIELLSRKPLLAEKVQELQGKLAQYQANPDYQRAAESYEALKAEQEAINAELLEKGGYVREVREIERDIARTKEAMSKPQAPARGATPPGGAPPAPAERLDDPCPAVLSLGADLFNTNVPAFGALLKDRCVQYFTALTDKRYVGVELEKDGKAFVLAAGKRIPAGELPGKDLDLLYLSLRLTLLEKYCTRYKAPVLVEDALQAVDPAKHALLGRMLKHLGSLGQVLHATTSPQWAQMADAVVNL